VVVVNEATFPGSGTPAGTVQVYVYVPGIDGVATIVAEEPGQKVGLFTVTTNGGLTVICKVVVSPHCPVTGVKVYVVVCVLSSAGDQTPVIPLRDIVGKGLIVPFGHIGDTTLNVGTIVGDKTPIVNVVDPTHVPDVGVKV
jgi:hypothetical protein